MVLEQLDIHRQKKKKKNSDTELTPFAKVDRIWIWMWKKKYKILIDNIYKNLEDLGFGKDFSFITNFIDS